MSQSLAHSMFSPTILHFPKPLHKPKAAQIWASRVGE
ncbi:MAG: hypothetical protein RLZZ407_1463 [Pseudomonadota bacterium]|jgi:hypothetical protein